MAVLLRCTDITKVEGTGRWLRSLLCSAFSSGWMPLKLAGYLKTEHTGRQGKYRLSSSWWLRSVPDQQWHFMPGDFE